MMVSYGPAQGLSDLDGILRLQQQNLRKALRDDQVRTEGFVTLEHDRALLEAMNVPYPHIVAKDADRVVGYALVMLRSVAPRIPQLGAMFDHLDRISHGPQPLAEANYFVMGQVCVARTHRGQGVFEGLYGRLSEQMSPDFDYVVTEISTENPRSLRAHAKVGFEVVKEYVAPSGSSWVIVSWRI